MTDRTLFDPDRTIPKACEVAGCEAVRQPGEDKAGFCAADLLRAPDYGTARPKNCLNAHDPAHAPFPEGF